MSGGGKCCAICKVVGLLVALGAVNWGLYGVFGIDLVAKFLGPMTTASKAVYGLIGVAGIAKIISFVKCCPCKGGGSCSSGK